MSDSARVRAARREITARGLSPKASYRACGRKVCHGDELAACWEAVRLSVLTGRNVEPYLCWWCGWWHCGGAPEPFFPNGSDHG